MLDLEISGPVQTEKPDSEARRWIEHCN